MKMPNATLCAEIQKNGAIPFVRFMELALYCPETGYYETKKDTVGRRGDFITSVSAGEIFGQLLAFQFGGWLENLSQFKIKNEKLKIIEAGAHDGKLAADILHWLKKFRPELFSEIEYCLLEPSPRRQKWQQETLKKFSNVRWFSNLSAVAVADLKSDISNFKLNGIIFGNELLDAFPVRRLGWDATGKKWFEWGVSLAGEKFVWTRGLDWERRHPAGGSAGEAEILAGKMPALRLPSAILHLPSSLLEVLPDGYTIETSPAAENWWHAAAKFLAHGKLLTIDYGFTAEEQFSPSRTRGTLRAYHRHRVSDDLLANVGEQDLTAHVNFSAIQKVGEEAGLTTETFCTQPQFLTRILAAAVKQNEFAQLDAKQVRQFQTLTHPEHLGRAFRVLVQAR